jgi:hypothetical protein
LNQAQVELLSLLISHLINEKVIYATSHIHNEDFDPHEALAQKEKRGDQSMIYSSKKEGFISEETEKAVCIGFLSGKEIWIPKSSIHSEYISLKNQIQAFRIENWILKKMGFFFNLVDKLNFNPKLKLVSLIKNDY